MRLEMWERLQAKHKVKTSELRRSVNSAVNSMPTVASTSSSSSMSSLMLDLLSRTSVVTMNVASITSSTDAADSGRPITVSQTPLPTVTVSSSNDVTSSSAVPPPSHRSARQQRESILHYMPALTYREAQSHPLSDSRFVALLAYYSSVSQLLAFILHQLFVQLAC